ncbi:hypothetical protein AURDEDRAFT_108989 [Auricularia subglabra TFB-10046 SS5]|uniref:UBX domain-containing protein n=1 Tax=Auricularia subglabra (strain TFB-10046 / SS5) TaxID=717982 RepID=J0LEV8_AURST|nr:hypothetical protein AURDEDRAFT_108989 [Auricularia subglabra TFB-10046 SS5]
MADLSDAQLAALEQLTAITNGADPEHERAILESVGWDVQKAAEAIFDQQPQAGPSISRPRRIEQMELDDSRQGRESARGVPATRVGLGLTNILALPFTLTLGVAAQILHFIFRVLRIPFPRLHFPTTFTFGFFRTVRGGSSPSSSLSPSEAADRFVRELEEETGAQSVSRAVASEPGTSSAAAKAREAGMLQHRRILPDFYIGSYEDALNAAKRDARILCVILLSSEHDDVPEFKLNTLTDPEFVNLLTDNAIIVWAGDVRFRDAYQAALKLGVTTYPSVHFLCLHPRRSNPSPSAAVMTVFSAHAGLEQTAPALLSTHLRATLLPRAEPFLQRVKAEQRTREEERRLRAEQDAAYEEAARRDLERVMARRREEERKAQEEREKAEKARAAERKRLNITRWRATVRPSLIPLEMGGSVRLAVRLPHGARAQRSFHPSDSLEGLYAFVDAQIAPAAAGDGERPDPGYRHEWAFGLAVAYPRALVPPPSAATIGEVASLTSGATLVAEMKTPEPQTADGDDYASESD